MFRQLMALFFMLIFGTAFNWYTELYNDSNFTLLKILFSMILMIIGGAGCATPLQILTLSSRNVKALSYQSKALAFKFISILTLNICAVLCLSLYLQQGGKSCFFCFLINLSLAAGLTISWALDIMNFIPNLVPLKR